MHINKHPMMFSNDFSQLIVHQIQKILIGMQYMAVDVKLNHRLTTRDRF